MMTREAPTCPVCEIHAESVFRVEGMDCHEEVAILERRLKTLPGLEAMSADVVAGRLRVAHDAALLSAAAISEAVAGTGMRAWLEHDAASRVTRTSRAPWPLIVPANTSSPGVFAAVSDSPVMGA